MFPFFTVLSFDTMIEEGENLVLNLVQVPMKLWPKTTEHTYVTDRTKGLHRKDE